MIRVILYGILVLLSTSIVAQQSRTLLYYTSPDTTQVPYVFTEQTAIADRFPIVPLSDNYMLEKFGFYYAIGTEAVSITVSIHEDTLGGPGAVVTNGGVSATWPIDLPGQEEGLEIATYHQVGTERDCFRLNDGNYYWLILEPDSPNTEFSWWKSASEYYMVGLEQSDQWMIETGQHAGAAKVYAEAIYAPDLVPNGTDYTVGQGSQADINGDNETNVLDIVEVVSMIVGQSPVNLQADFNSDEVVNVVDILALVNHVVGNSELPEIVDSWVLTDLNESSDTYNTFVGPKVYDGKVSLYYFAKATCSICQHRFSVLNDLYLEIIEEENQITADEFTILGLNKYNYSGSSLTSMLSGHILPWVDDIATETYSEFAIENFADDDDDGSSEDEASAACQAAGHTWNGYLDECGDPYATSIMNAGLRDLVFVDRHGVEYARLNLTGYNPDPGGVGECSGNYETIKTFIVDKILEGMSR